MDSLKQKTETELLRVIELFPWFAAARVELYRRKIAVGGELPADAALYAPSRRLLFNAKRSAQKADYHDSDLETLLKEAPKRKVVAVGGDFFSQDQYDGVRRDGDSLLSTLAAKLPQGDKSAENDDILMSFCTETLAQIYVDQGYYEPAKYIYTKLLLRYPEKNVYFAGLIEKLEQLERD